MTVSFGKVQELVPHVVCEHRVLCFRDELGGPQFVREHLWLRMKAKGEHHNHQASWIQKCSLAHGIVKSAR